MDNDYRQRKKLTIKDEDVAELNLESYARFKCLLTEYKTCLDSFAAYVEYYEYIDLSRQNSDKDSANELSHKRMRDLFETFDNFILEFKEKTNLDMELRYYDSYNESSSYDGTDSHYYTLYFPELYKETDIIKKLKKNKESLFSKELIKGGL